MDRNQIDTLSVSDWHGIDVRSTQIGSMELTSDWHRIGTAGLTSDWNELTFDRHRIGAGLALECRIRFGRDLHRILMDWF